MAKKYKIYPNVKIGKGAKIGDFAVIGIPAEDKKGPAARTVIGENAAIRSHAVIYAGNIIGDNLRTGHHVLIRENNRIGNNVSIGSGTVIEHHVRIEDGVRIHSQAFIPEYSVLEKGCWIGPRAALTNALHPLCPRVKECLKGPRIKRGAIIGANATVLPDVEVAENALVGAGSVVVADVPRAAVVAGNPARKINRVSHLRCRYGLVDRPYKGRR